MSVLSRPTSGRLVRRVVVALAVTLGAATIVNGASAAGDQLKIMVVGDSYSARYTDETGSTARAWWSYLREDLDATVTVSAQSGAGILMRGDNCQGVRIGDLSTLTKLRDADPDVLVVESGANDWGHCVNGVRTSHMSTPTLVKGWVDRYMAQLAKDAATVGIPKNRIYVTSFWAAQNSESTRTTIVNYYAAAAKANGFKFVPMPRLTVRNTLDGSLGNGDRTHPNITGSRELFYQFMAASDLDAYAVR